MFPYENVKYFSLNQRVTGSKSCITHQFVSYCPILSHADPKIAELGARKPAPFVGIEISARRMTVFLTVSAKSKSRRVTVSVPKS